jgi:hypothetical protein
MLLRACALSAVLLGFGLSVRSALADVKFKPAVTYNVSGADYALAVDMDADGKLDIIGSATGGVFVLYGNGDGTFGLPLYLAAANGYETVAADFNGDGKLDLAEGCIHDDAIAIFLATGPRTFGPRTFFATGDAPYGVAAGDVNGDGAADLVASNAGSPTLSVLINKADGSGAFKPQTTLPMSGANHAVIFDANLDGKMDIAASNYDGAVGVFLGDGAGGFSAPIGYQTHNGSIGILSADFNNDGWPDMATANYWSGTSTIFLNNGSGFFLPQTPIAAGGLPHILRAADIDLDGLPDLVIPNAGSASFNVQLNLGGGNMGGSIFFTTPAIDSRSVATGDFNGDGRIDVAVADNTKPGVFVRLNESDIPKLVSLSLSPTSVRGGQSAVGTVTIDFPASGGGTKVALSSNSQAVGVPAQVTIPFGLKTANFAVSTGPVASQVTATITASGGGANATATLKVLPAVPYSITFSSNPVYGGALVTATLNLSSPAPTGGLQASLQSVDTSAATVPTSVTVPAGASSATFPVQTYGISSQVLAVIKATANGATINFGFTVKPAVPGGITFNPANVFGGFSSTATLTLLGKAPAGGLVVSLASKTPSVVAPSVSTVTVPAGTSTAQFSVATSPVTSLTLGVIAATANGSTGAFGLRVYPAVPSAITWSANPVFGGAKVTATLKLSSPAPPGGLEVSLSAQNTFVASISVNSVTVPAGQTTATFDVQTYPVAITRLGLITATANGKAITFGLTIKAAVPYSMKFTPNPVKGGLPVSGSLTLSSVAPKGGLTIALTAQNPERATGPSSLFVPEGQKTASFNVTTYPVATSGLAVFAATANGGTIKIGFMVVP